MKLCFNKIEFDLSEDLFHFLEENLKSSSYCEYIDFGEDMIKLADWLSIRYTNSLFKFIIDKIDEYVTLYAIANPNIASELASYKACVLGVPLYAFNIYSNAKEDMNAHISIIRAISSYTSFIKDTITESRK